MRIRPTELGWKGLLLLLALECAFLATAYSNLFFLLITFCMVLGVLGMFWTCSNLRGLRLLRLEVPAAAAGVTRTIVLELQTRRPCADVAIELVLADETLEVGQTPLVATTCCQQGTLPARDRGICKVHAVRLSSRFPLGLFVARRDLPVAEDIVTYPAPQSAAMKLHAALAAHAVDAVHSQVARGATALELRPFRTGDALGDVHWKATARRGQPVVKEREREGGGALAIVLDRRCSPAALETALGMLATLVLQGRARTGLLRLVSQEASFTLGQDPAMAKQMLRWLAGATTLPPDAVAPPHLAGAIRLPARTDTEGGS